MRVAHGRVVIGYILEIKDYLLENKHKAGAGQVIWETPSLVVKQVGSRWAIVQQFEQQENEVF